MPSIENIKSAIELYLRKDITPYAIMIDGDWGVGKTHLFENEIAPNISNQGYIYISLYGLTTINDIENEIFKAMSFVGDDEGGILKNLLNSNPDILEGVKIGGLGYAVQFGLQKWKSIKLKDSKALVVVFDDIERWQGDISTCLAYINKTVEHEQRKCILIGSLKQIDKKNERELLNSKEKTIKHIYKLESESETVIEAALGLVSFSTKESECYIKKLLFDNKNKIHHILESSNYKNIRVVCDSIQYLDYIFIENEEKFNIGKTLAGQYYGVLLSALILLRRYITNGETQKIIIESGGKDKYKTLKDIEFLNSDNKPDYINQHSKFLIENTFYISTEINITGIFSIIDKGFYNESDFADNFSLWIETQPYQLYLDVFTYWDKEDSVATKIFTDTYNSMFKDKSIRNPTILLTLTDRITTDIKRGILGLNFLKTKEKISNLFTQLYDDTLMESSHIDGTIGNREGFQYSKDILLKVQDRNKLYLKQIADTNNQNFWMTLSGDIQGWNDIFLKNQTKPIFSYFHDPIDIIDVLEKLKNNDLFELTRLMGSRISDSSSIDAVDFEAHNCSALTEAINSRYSATFGVRAGHFKQIARILKNRSTIYDPEA